MDEAVECFIFFRNRDCGNGRIDGFFNSNRVLEISGRRFFVSASVSLRVLRGSDCTMDRRLLTNGCPSTESNTISTIHHFYYVSYSSSHFINLFSECSLFDALCHRKFSICIICIELAWRFTDRWIYFISTSSNPNNSWCLKTKDLICICSHTWHTSYGITWVDKWENIFNGLNWSLKPYGLVC